MAEWKDCSQSAPISEFESDLNYLSCYGYENLYGQTPLPFTHTGASLPRSGSEGTVASSVETGYKEGVIHCQLDSMEPKMKSSVTKTRDLLKRRDQNRASRRTYRQRRRHSRDLEAKVKELMNSLDSTNFENNVAQPDVKRAEIALNYYRQILEAKRELKDTSLLMTETCVTSTVGSNIPYIGPLILSEEGSDSQLIAVRNPFNWLIDAPAKLHTSGHTGHFTSHGYASSYTTTIQTFERLCPPIQSPTQSTESMNIHSLENMVPITENLQDIRKFATGSEDKMLGLNMVGWENGDSVLVPSHSQAYIQNLNLNGIGIVVV